MAKRVRARGAVDPELEEVRRRLSRESFPRFQMLLIVTLAGLGAFLGSVSLLHAGLGNMALRYLIAVAIGYLLFLALVRAWLAYQRRRWSPEVELPDIGSGGGGGAGGAEPPPFSGGGGSFGGGGARGSFGPSNAPADASQTSGMLDGIPVPDVDEAWPFVLGVAALLAGLVALAFVVYASPILFAEVLLDAAVMGAVYRRARRHDRGHWLHGVLRRTWLPALALGLFVAFVGFALQASAPDARSIGAVLRERAAARAE